MDSFIEGSHSRQAFDLHALGVELTSVRIHEVGVAGQFRGIPQLPLSGEPLVVGRGDVDRKGSVTFFRFTGRHQNRVAAELQPSFTSHTDHPTIPDGSSLTRQRGALLSEDLGKVNCMCVFGG